MSKRKSCEEELERKFNKQKQSENETEVTPLTQASETPAIVQEDELPTKFIFVQVKYF